MSFGEMFCIQRDSGWLVAVALPELGADFGLESLGELTSEEVAYAQTLEARRAGQFVGGRLALRSALGKLNAPKTPSLPNPRGAPIVPAGYRGSITHKDDVAVAYACLDTGWHVGVDVEVPLPERTRIASRVLTTDELEAIDGLEPTDRWLATLTRFSLKEAIYKAIDPLVKRYVGFKEVALTPEQSGAVSVHMRLKTPENLEIYCELDQQQGLIISLAKARFSHPV